MNRRMMAFVVAAAAASFLPAAQFTSEEIVRMQEEAALLQAPTTPPEVLPGGYLKIGFDRLATFPIELPRDAFKLQTKAVQALVDSQIPDTVKALEGKKVLVTGYPLPLKVEKGLVTEIMLQQLPVACCFGITPVVNQWIHVKMPKGVKVVQDVPLSIYGILRLNIQVDSLGVVMNIYDLDGEKLAGK